MYSWKFANILNRLAYREGPFTLTIASVNNFESAELGFGLKVFLKSVAAKAELTVEI